MKRRGRFLLLSCVIALVLSVAVLLVIRQLARNRERTATRCDAFMRRFSPPFTRLPVIFTAFVSGPPRAGQILGLKPGWILEYRDPATGSSVKYFVDLSGEVIDADPTRWRNALDKANSPTLNE